MPELQDQVLAIVKKNIDVPGLFNDTIDQILEPALLAAVQKSETKIDDIVVAALEPMLKVELKKFVKEKWEALLSAPAGGGDLVSEQAEVLGEPV